MTMKPFDNFIYVQSSILSLLVAVATHTKLYTYTCIKNLLAYVTDKSFYKHIWVSHSYQFIDNKIKIITKGHIIYKIYTELSTHCAQNWLNGDFIIYNCFKVFHNTTFYHCFCRWLSHGIKEVDSSMRFWNIHSNPMGAIHGGWIKV